MGVEVKSDGPYSLFCTQCCSWFPNTANYEMKREGVIAHSHWCDWEGGLLSTDMDSVQELNIKNWTGSIDLSELRVNKRVWVAHLSRMGKVAENQVGYLYLKLEGSTTTVIFDSKVRTLQDIVDGGITFPQDEVEIDHHKLWQEPAASGLEYLQSCGKDTRTYLDYVREIEEKLLRPLGYCLQIERI